MAEIEIHFTEYFDGEVLRILNGGRELYRSEPLKTDVRTGLAKIAKIAVPVGRSSLTFEELSKKTNSTATIDADQLHHVRVTLKSGRLEVAPVSESDYQREPRGYL